MESKTGIKTIDKISEIPVVNSALNNVTDYYGKVKEKNVLLRTSCNLAEMSFKTMAFAAQPFTTLCKKPIESVDSYLSTKVDQLEKTYPAITKPTEQLTAQAVEIYDKTVKQPIENLNNIKEKTVTDLKNYGTNTVSKSVDMGFKMVDKITENKYAKMITKPVLDLTENALKYMIPDYDVTAYSESSVIPAGEEPTTLRRIYNINNRVYRHIHQTTFNQLTKLHVQFENTIAKLQSLKKFTDMIYSDSKVKLNNLVNSVSESSLVAQCAKYIDTNNLSMNKIEAFSKNYYKAILNDFSETLEKYLSLVKNFPVVFNGSKLKQTVETLLNQLNKEQFNIYLQKTIDNLKTMHQTLLSYTTQMFQVVNESKFMNLLKRTPSHLQLKANQQSQTDQNHHDQHQQTENKKLIDQQTSTTTTPNISILKEDQQSESFNETEYETETDKSNNFSHEQFKESETTKEDNSFLTTDNSRAENVSSNNESSNQSHISSNSSE